jgi:hypothetical protein
VRQAGAWSWAANSKLILRAGHLSPRSDSICATTLTSTKIDVAHLRGGAVTPALATPVKARPQPPRHRRHCQRVFSGSGSSGGRPFPTTR